MARNRRRGRTNRRANRSFKRNKWTLGRIAYWVLLILFIVAGYITFFAKSKPTWWPAFLSKLGKKKRS